MVDLEEKVLSLYAKKFLKTEMGKNSIKIPDLAEKMNIDSAILSNRISRGSFSVGFFLKVLQTIETKEMPIPPKEMLRYLS